MSKKIIYLFIGACVIIAIVLFARNQKSADAPAAGVVSGETQVRAAVAEFGARLKNKADYSDLVSPELAAGLKQKLRGERIDIIELAPQDDGAYVAQAQIIDGGSAYPVALKLRDSGGRWLITGISGVMPQ